MQYCEIFSTTLVRGVRAFPVYVFLKLFFILMILATWNMWDKSR